MKKKIANQKNVEVFALSNDLRKYNSTNTAELLKNFNSRQQGLNSEEAKLRLETKGANVITATRTPSWVKRLFEAIINPFNLVLIGIAVITFLTDVVFSQRADYVTSIIIIGLVLISGGVAFVQTEKSDRAAEKLYNMISNRAEVYRDGNIVSLPIEELVPGDVIRLTAGALIPADVRFLTTKDAFVSQSALTGESEPIEKLAISQDIEGKVLTDLKCIGFLGTNMVSGVATALVVATGDDTYFGHSAALLSGGRSQNS
ncbi:MAG: cation-transporting P-type ATPase, partial [Christensenellales bacterium]